MLLDDIYLSWYLFSSLNLFAASSRVSGLLTLHIQTLKSPSLGVSLYRYLFTLDLPEYWENKHADQTLEVLMSDLDPAIMDQFYMKDGVSASDVTRVSMPPSVQFR